MIKLSIFHSDEWLELDKDVRVMVRPLGAQVMFVAQAEVRKQMKLLSIDAAEEPEKHRALLQMHLAHELAQQAIMDWEGVHTMDGAEAEVNEDNIYEFMSIWFINQAFFEKYTSTLDALYDEGNASGLAANGISAAGQATAEDATSSNSPAPKPRKARASAPMSKTNP